jgi:hypothetical protein
VRPFTAPSCWLRSHIARCYPNRAAPSISQSLFLSDSTVSLSRASRKHNPAMAAPRIAAAVRRTDGAAWSPLSPSSPPRPAVQRIRDDQSQRRALATSSLPPFVIRGISVTGRQRYGVKINTPGQVHRKQVRRSPPLFHLTQSTHMCTHPQHIPSPLSHTMDPHADAHRLFVQRSAVCFERGGVLSESIARRHAREHHSRRGDLRRQCRRGVCSLPRSIKPN